MSEPRSCQHPHTEPVLHTLTGEVLAEVCPTCLASLPAGYNCLDCEHDEIRILNGDTIRTITEACEQHR